MSAVEPRSGKACTGFWNQNAHLMAVVGENKHLQELMSGKKGGNEVSAVLESDDINLAFVTGARPDLIKVRDGSEHAAPASVKQIRFQRRVAPFLNAWQSFGYDEAHDGLQKIPVPEDDELRKKLFFARDISKAFSAWDRFNHVSALKMFEIYRNIIAKIWLNTFLFLQALNNQNDPVKLEFARLIDLRFNAERRAKQGRYDDAVARLYRLIEWMGQWLLKKYCDLDTGNLDMKKLPEPLHGIAHRHHDGKMKTGLFGAWELIGRLIPGVHGDFFKNQENNLKKHIQNRNNSILDHGSKPVSSQEWKAMWEWMKREFWPLVSLEAEKVSLGIYGQLPNQFPDWKEMGFGPARDDNYGDQLPAK